MRRISAFIFMAVLLFGCGGGSPVQDVQTIHDYSRPAYQSPNYHPHEGLSYIHTLNDTTYIGGDVSPRETLRRIGTHVSGITLSMGASRDGVGVDRIQNYLTIWSPRMDLFKHLQTGSTLFEYNRRFGMKPVFGTFCWKTMRLPEAFTTFFTL